MAQRGIVRAVRRDEPRIPLLPPIGYRIGAAQAWVPNYQGYATFTSGGHANASFAQNRAGIVTTLWPYTTVVDAASFWINSANDGASARCGIVLYDLTNDRLIRHCGTASLNTGGVEIVITFAPTTIPGGIVLCTLAYFAGLNTSGTNPAIGVWSNVTVTAMPFITASSSAPAGNSNTPISAVNCGNYAANDTFPTTASWMRAAHGGSDFGPQARVFLRLGRGQNTWA
jgi:hypothetical protein